MKSAVARFAGGRGHSRINEEVPVGEKKKPRRAEEGETH